MKPAVKKRWVKALRSGKFKQGRKALRPTKDTYCCLGVLLKTEGVQFRKRHGGGYDVRGNAVGNRKHDLLPQWFMAKAGLEYDTCRGLAHMNDIDGKTLPEIADHIEANL